MERFGPDYIKTELTPAITCLVHRWKEIFAILKEGVYLANINNMVTQLVLR